MTAHVADRLVRDPALPRPNARVGVITGVRERGGARPILPDDEPHAESAEPARAPSKVDQ